MRINYEKNPGARQQVAGLYGAKYSCSQANGSSRAAPRELVQRGVEFHV